MKRLFGGVFKFFLRRLQKEIVFLGYSSGIFGAFGRCPGIGGFECRGGVFWPILGIFECAWFLKAHTSSGFERMHRIP